MHPATQEELARRCPTDLLPINRTSYFSKKSINPENDGHENKQIQRRANHWLPAAGRSGHADQGEVTEVIQMDGMIADLITRLRKLAKDDRHGWVFPNADGNAYTAQAFKLGFARLKKAARKAGKLPKNFTMHDLRHYFVTAFKLKNKELPELHADSATTSRIYDDSKEVNRRGL